MILIPANIKGPESVYITKSLSNEATLKKIIVMKSNSEIRAIARQALKGNWAVSALFVFVFVLVVWGVMFAGIAPFMNNETASPLVQIILTLALLPIQWGMYVSFKRLLNKRELELSWLFDGYKGSRIWTTTVLQTVYTMLWSLLLIIPGIIKSYSYAMTPYILEDNPELKNNAAIEKSMEMMQGHKLDLFLLDLSFIGWAFLCMLTFGLGFFWLESYMLTARAAFYEELLHENASAEVE